MTKKKRIWELDFWRGLAIILVVFDHAFYDFARIFSPWRYSGNAVLEFLNSVATDYLSSDVRAFWRPAFLFLFFCVAGICTALSKNNVRRGIKLWLVAMLISAVTLLGEKIIGERMFILFGVIHCLAVVILIYAVLELAIKYSLKLVEKFSKKEIKPVVKTVITTVIMLGLAVATLLINLKYNPKINEASYTVVTPLDGKLYGMLFYSKEWRTADYFPLFPYISFFFLGSALAKILYREKKSLFPYLDGAWHNVFSLAGRHSLLVYVFGQVVAILLGIILSLICLGDPILF